MKNLKSLLITVLTISILCLPSCKDYTTADDGNSGNPASAEDTESTVQSESVESQISIKDTVDYDIDLFNFKGVAYITCGGEKVYSSCSGYADEEEKVKITEDTAFNIGSVTKQFTAAAVLMLQEQGKISVNDTLDKYFPEYEDGKEITVHHLLSMRSGIPNYIEMAESGVDVEKISKASFEENKKFIESWILSQKLKFNPDEHFEYSNSNYFLLAEIIEKVTGAEYHKYIQENIFDKLGMSSTAFSENWSDSTGTKAEPFNQIESEQWSEISGIAFGCGDIISTAPDLTKWAESLINQTLINEESYKLMISNYSNSSDSFQYGYGVMLSDGIIYHNGNIGSYFSNLTIAPETHTVMVMLNNTHFNNIDSVSKRISSDLADL